MTDDLQPHEHPSISRRHVLIGGTALAALAAAGIEYGTTTPAYAAPAGYCWPYPSTEASRVRIVSPFGMRFDPVYMRYQLHDGIDLNMPSGDSIHAVAAGIVSQNDTTGGYGNHIMINHANGIQTLYGHMSARSPLAVGASVAEAQVVGLVGQTGAATGPHLHLLMHQNGTPIDPAAFLAGAPFSDQITQPPTTEDDDMAQPFYYVASSNNASVTVGTGDIWVRSQPGEPLRRLTQAQATEYFVRDKLDFNSPNVKSWTGAQFDTAFAEDAVVHGYNKTVHTWLP